MAAILAPPITTEQTTVRKREIRRESSKKRVQTHQREISHRPATPLPVSNPPLVEPYPSTLALVDRSVVEAWRATLPLLPWEDGYRIVSDPMTGETREVQLTLYDLLYESEEDIGVVSISQSADHFSLSAVMAILLQAYRTGWLFLSDVYVRWGIPGICPKGPDVIAVPGGRMPPKGQKSFVVGRDGPIPAFVIEITSEGTRSADLKLKKEFYASMGVQEYLIIDLWPEKGTDWQLIGYRLTNEPTYTPLTADAQGGITFETIGLRFVAVSNTNVLVFDSVTGEQLLTATELKARAEAETEARINAEAREQQSVYRMHQSGFAAPLIAELLDLPLAKVEAMITAHRQTIEK